MELKAGLKNADVRSIPEDWNLQTLLSASIKITDGEHVTPRRCSQGYLLLSARNILDGKIDISDVDYVPAYEYGRIRKRCNPEPGDILISCSGTIGRIAVVPLGMECVLVRSVALAKLRPEVDSVFIHYWLRSDTAQKQIADSVNQGAQPNLFLNKIERLECVVPSMFEQKTIAAALSNIDDLLASLDALIAKKRDLKQAAMQQLLTGERRLAGFTQEWVNVIFGEIARIRNDKVKTAGLPNAEFCVELEQIGQGTGEISGFSDARSRSSIKYQFLDGDVLFGRLRPYLRKYWFANCSGVCSTEIWPLVPVDGHVNKTYLFQIVQTESFIEVASGSYGTHMPRSDWNVLKRFQLRVPADPTEQQAIATILSDMDSEITALEARRDKTHALKQGMMQELLSGRIRLL